jgi:NADH dehydrogenase FAD-containing subunit
MARRLVIIGGDAAGLSAATQVGRMKTAAELEIVVFERSSRNYLCSLWFALPDRRIR